MEQNPTAILVTLEYLGRLLHEAYKGICEGDMERVEEAFVGMSRLINDSLRAEGSNVVQLLPRRGKRG